MAARWSRSLWMAKMVFLSVSSCVFSCFSVADEIAASLRTGDIGPFHVG
ncbi:hypothetical protein Leryth_024727 [Lithospermum erythrorhizon]|nr:hypothetical protein Leryth_024727 [Lithospermum erythrorhizon]